MNRSFKEGKITENNSQKKKKELSMVSYATSPWDLLTPLFLHSLLLASVNFDSTTNTFLIQTVLLLLECFNNALK